MLVTLQKLRIVNFPSLARTWAVIILWRGVTMSRMYRIRTALCDPRFVVRRCKTESYGMYETFTNGWKFHRSANKCCWGCAFWEVFDCICVEIREEIYQHIRDNTKISKDEIASENCYRSWEKEVRSLTEYIYFILMKHETRYVNYILGSLHRVDIVVVVKVSEVYGASIFKVGVCKIDEFLCTYVWDPASGKNEAG
jgi:hypothetical protein